MPKDTGYAPDSRSGVSSDTKSFPPNVEPRGQQRFGPPPYPERPPVKNIFNVDAQGRVQPRRPWS